MEPQVRNLVDISTSPAALRSCADLVLGRAQWATQVFQRYDRSATMAIVDAVAQAIHDNAQKYADWAVEETGFGVPADKKLKNELSAFPLVDYYRDEDFINPQIDIGRKIVKIPRPAGVIVALTPATNPISTINYKIIMALMTRNAIVISPHPAARACCVDAAEMLARAAVSAGAPDGIIQIIEQPNIPLIEEFMKSPKTSLILATGGDAMVRAAYSSSNPAMGVGPGNAPVFVDSSADISKAAERIVDSKSFDNSVLCTNESVLVTLTQIDKQLRRALEGYGAYICSDEETEVLRRFLFHAKGFNVEAVGRDAVWIAQECGIRVPVKTRILVTPITQIGVEERLSKEKLCPVLAYHVVPNRTQAIAQARAILRLTGAGHSAAIHATDERVIMEYASTVEVYRVIVNAPSSQGSAGFQTNLAPAFTIGTGFFGRSSIGENIGPQHLVHWTRIAYNKDPSETFGHFENLGPEFAGPLPQAPADGVPGSSSPKTIVPPNSSSEFTGLKSSGPKSSGPKPYREEFSREELRKLIAEELRAALKR
ncbi:MAG: aldehyde dehydrogenase [Alphaproteobacteria bacterium]|nr:MAG: aldehyde dehydrogenase [Alphaproteobacteria bacterium]